MTGAPKVPKYLEIVRHIEDDVRSGTYVPGEKLPSEGMLIRRYSTSRITVGRAFRELVQKGLVVRRPGSGTYVCADMASAGSANRLFGLLLPDIDDTEIFAPICQGMARARRGSALVWGSSATNSETKEAHALALCAQYISQKVSGVFFTPLHSAPEGEGQKTNVRIIAALGKANIPVVLIDCDLVPYPKRSEFDLIGIDNRRAGYMITEHLLERGCRRIGFISYPNPSPTVQARIAGFHEALFSSGADSDRRLVQTINASEMSEVQRVLQAIRPEAFVCCNDLRAAQVMQSLMKLGHKIPDEIRIGSIDDVKYARLMPIALTTVHQPCHEIGEAAMAAMMERVARPNMPGRQILLNCRLVVRQSSGLPPVHKGRASIRPGSGK